MLRLFSFKSLMRTHQIGVFLAGVVLIVFFIIYADYKRLAKLLEQPVSENPLEQEILERTWKYTNHLPNSTEVTVVTAYFNLGSLEKGRGGVHQTPQLYKRWMSTFRRLDNPLIVFADTNETVEHFRQLRAHYPPSRTTLLLINRTELWAFQLAREIESIFSQPGYPYHPPNTIKPLYSCAMHAKYELVQRVIREQLYQTRFITWLDIGYFRDEVNTNRIIHLTVPTDFKRTHVACSQVGTFQTSTPMDIIRGNKVWTAGGAFLATPQVMYVYCSEYRRAVRKLLDMKWMSTDQQVIYSMFQPSFNFTRRFQLQTYSGKPGSNPWFTLGYSMLNAP